MLWTNKEEAGKIMTAAAALERCSPVIMPNIRQLLLILATLLACSCCSQFLYI